MKTLALSLPLLLTLWACAASRPEPAPTPVPLPAPVPAPVDASVLRLRAHMQALLERPEHTAQQVRVQHCLIAVEGLIPGVTRNADEAEALAAELYARVQAGADFDALVKQYTNDEHPGIYAMCLGEPPAADVYPREVMALAFGDVAWRLAVGEVGVTRYDGERFDIEARSPFGFQLVKRLE